MMIVAAVLRTAPWSGTYAKLVRVTEVQPPPASGGEVPAPALRADDLARLTRGRLLARSSRPIRGGAVDSRAVTPGNLFVALPGERTDGHRFLGAAATAGAGALIVSHDLAPEELGALGDVTIVQVADGLRALHAVAAAWRAQFSPVVVGVTGSIAKTSTKEAIAAVLSRRFATLKNEGNLNNEIGLPLTVLRMGPEHEAAVLEMGMYVGGEIADLARIAQPQIGLVTAVQPVHLARIGTLDAIERAKAELVEALPADGTAVLNADDPRVRRMAGRTQAQALLYGFAEEADVRADSVTSAGTAGMRFRLRLPGAVAREVAIPTLGRLAVHNALGAAAVGVAAGISEADIVDGLADGWTAPHRTELVAAGGVTIVDDTYNASPSSVLAALELLAGLPGRRIAVLGEMLELGAEHAAGHRAVGDAAASVCDLLVVIGDGAAGIVEGARAAGMDAARIHVAADPAAALALLQPLLRRGDVVLVKASRGIALDVFVDELAAGLRSSPAARSSSAARSSPAVP